MRIALEIGLNVAGKRGMDQYFQGLMGGLARVDAVNHYSAFTYFFKDFQAKRERFVLPPGASFELCARRWPERIVNSVEWSWGWPLIDSLFVKPSGIQLYHGLGGRLPHLRGVPSVVTVHDLIPERSGRPSASTEDAARRADRIIAISRHTRDDLVDFYRVDPAKISVVYNGLDHERFRPVADPRRREELARGAGLSGPFLLFVGPFEPRRNAERALEALAELRRGGLGRDLLLVFSGNRNAFCARIEEAAARHGLAQDLRFIGHVPDEDMPLLYGMAEALVHPTLYEGFGFPVLEAMACGLPVLTSNASSIPEVAGDAAVQVDPESVPALAAGLKELLTRPGLRAELREKGLARARSFTWDRAARETLRVYEALGAPPRAPAGGAG